MIQNNPKVIGHDHSQLSPGQDCSELSNKLSYTQMVEGIEQQQLSCQKDSIQLSQAHSNTRMVGKGPQTERFHNTFIEDFLQRSQNYIQKPFSNNRPILQRNPSFQQSEKSKPAKSLFDNFLAVKKFPDTNLGRVRRASNADQRFASLQPERILGREIISSVVKPNHHEQPEPIEEGSQIIDNLVSTGQRSHFKIENVEAVAANIFQQFQQRKKNALISGPQEIKITITPEPSKRSSQFTLSQGGPNAITFGVVGNTKFSMKSQSRQGMVKRSTQEMRILSSLQKPSEKDYLNSIGLKGSKIKRVDNNMIQSKIITPGPLNQPEKRTENQPRILLKDSDQKRQIIQVADRMKSTIDPMLPSSEFKVVPVQSNLSQPDRHSVKNMPQQNAKIIEPLSPSQESPQKKEIDTNIRPDIQGYLMTKIKSIEKLVDNLKQCSFCQVQHLKCSIPHGDIQLKQKRSKNINQKKESQKKMIADEFFNGLSSIDSDQKSKPRMNNPDRHERNAQFDKKFEFLAERILKMQEIMLKRVTSNDCNCELVEEEMQTYDPRTFKMNRRNSSSQTKILKKVKSDTRLYEPIFEQESISDEDFIRLNSLPKINFILKRSSNPQELAELGIKILNMFKIKTQKGDSMDMTQFQNGIQFYYSTSNVFIRLQFSGLFFIGNGENVQYSHQFVKSGEGIQILPNKYTFQGEFHEDKKEGQGIISYVSGDRYKGQWSNDMYEGYGVLYSESSRYKGTFHEGKKHGFGKEIFKNGDTYEGPYYLGNYNGSGKYNWSNGTSYVGDFQNDKMSGQGVWRSYCGDVYEGQFCNGKRHGQGRYKKRSGEILEGQFNEGKLSKRKCKGMLPLQKQLNFDSFDEESPRMTINSGFSPRDLNKGNKITIERQPSLISPLKSKKYSAKW